MLWFVALVTCKALLIAYNHAVQGGTRTIVQGGTKEHFWGYNVPTWGLLPVRVDMYVLHCA